MFNIDLWREIFQNIAKNKLRTILSGFTIAFAILLFTLLSGIGKGLMNNFTEQFASDAYNSIYIWSGKTSKPYKGLQSGRDIQFKNDDFRFILDEFDEELEMVSPRIQRYNVKAVYKAESYRYTIRAVYPSYQVLESAKMEAGRFLNMLDLEERRKVVAIGRLVAQDLFGVRNAIGKSISLDDISYRVIGVFNDPGGDNDERFIYMPFSTAQRLYGNTDHLDEFGLTYDPGYSSSKALSFGTKILKKLKAKHKISPRDQSGIRMFNYAMRNEQVNGMMIGLNVIILFIGIGTLIAGVIGIGNIMVYIVKERSKEIGIRKALGATPRSIVGMIMQESIFVTALAGYFGLLMGMFVLELIGSNLNDYGIVDPSVGTSVIVGATIILVLAGTIAGYVPAKQAARIKPIEALNDD